MLKVSAFYLERQKVLFLKRIFFKPLSISKQKNALFTDPNFSEGFVNVYISKKYLLILRDVLIIPVKNACM